MLPRADYHMHSEFSPDARSTMENMGARALAQGLEEIAFTDHLDIHPLDNPSDFYRPDAYFAELARCQKVFAGRLTIRAGIEIGESHRYPERVRPVLGAHPYDFVLGSVHWIGDEMPFGNQYFATHEKHPTFAGYFGEMVEMAASGEFDVVAHLDMPKREGTAVWGPFDPRAYGDEIRQILRRLIDRGKGIEINTSGWRRPNVECCPDPLILAWYHELGGEVLTIGSDAHGPEHVALFRERALDVARAAGLRWLTTFTERRATQHPL